ncbi:sulfatase-like hydrolase/transferase [Lutibacter citreus]|uniref:sulfatase-like hydrolase/transferase n=1 Tax=Lutibacter citreus TaxID=2138210 RepID=UPI000DBE0940|nr:sulfatase-like hydrolase/transferase [Lutibacter citreus]
MKKTLGLILTLCCFQIIQAQKNQKSVASSLSNPNILWIITDDQRADALEVYNRETIGKSESSLGYVMSPNIDKLASEGTLFTNTYCNSPMCAISRPSMHMGRHAFRSGHYKFFSHQEADISKPFLSQILRKEGYGTAVFGKTHFATQSKLNPKERKPNDMFDLVVEFKRDLNNKGFGSIFTSGAKQIFIDGVFQLVNKHETATYPDGTKYVYMTNNSEGEIPKEDKKMFDKVNKDFNILRARTRLHNTLIIGGENPKKAGETVDGYIVKEFKNHLSNANKKYKTYGGRTVNGVDTTKPAFLNLSFHLPHTPVLPPKKFRDIFKNKKYKLPEFTTDELSKFPPQLVILYNECKADRLTNEEKQQAIRDYYAFCAYGDSLIGESVEAFKKYCKENNQEYLILFTVGDHGWHLGEQGVMSKFGPWKQSVHNATIVVSSNKDEFPAGEVCEEITEYVDFAPTMLAAAGVDINQKEYDYLDGYDLNKVQKGTTTLREYALGEQNIVCGHRAFMRNGVFAFSMRTRDEWDYFKAPDLNKNITWALTCDRPKADMALYDLRVDPLEKNNVANDKDYVALADWFRNKLGTIVLGDRRVEADWTKLNSYNVSSFARGADDKKLDIPQEIIPNVK